MSHYQKFEIPESWRWVSIDEIADVVTGSTPSKDHKEYYGGDVPFYKPSDLEQGLFTSTASDWLTPKGYEQARKLPKDSVLVTCIGATIGKTGRIVTEGSCNQQINAVILHNDILSEYFYDVCLSDYFQSEIKNNASATTLPILNKNNFSSIEIPLPPRNEQKRILEEVNKLFSIIGNIESCESTIISSIDVAKSKILELAMQGKLVPQDPDDEPAADMLRRVNPKARIITDNPHYPQLPDNWVYVSLVDIVDYEQPQPFIVNDTDYSEKYYTPVLTAGKSFILGYTNENFGVYNKLPVIIFDDFTTDSHLVNFPFKVKSSAMKILTVKEGINVEYVSYFMSITRLVGDTHKRYWISEYSKLPIPLPPITEQDRIVLAVEKLNNQIDSIQNMLN